MEISPRRVLVIEDDPCLREVLTLALSWEGYAVAAAEHGGVALAALDAFSPDVIVADLTLPLVDGRAFLREYRRRGGTAPVVITTGHAAGFGDLDGVADVLVKPFELDALLGAVATHTQHAARAG